MFDIGWSEMLVIAVVLIVVVGPSDLPRVLRSFGKYAGQLRRMAGDFQRQVNDAMREAELDDVRRDIESVRRIHPASQVRSMLTGGESKDDERQPRQMRKQWLDGFARLHFRGKATGANRRFIECEKNVERQDEARAIFGIRRSDRAGP